MQLSSEQHVPDPVIYPSPEWRAAFREQMTPQTMESAISAVEVLLEGPDGHLCSSSAEDLVHDALVATGHGEISWRPDRIPLWVHLRDRARAELRRERQRAMRETSLDECEDDAGDAVAIERDYLATVPDLPAAIDLGRAMKAEEARLWRLAARDQGVLAVMNARAHGHFSTAAIASASGMSHAAVTAARRRLARLMRQPRQDAAELAS